MNDTIFRVSENSFTRFIHELFNTYFRYPNDKMRIWIQR